MFGFEYRFDTRCLLCIVSRYRLILDKFYVTFQGCHLGALMVIVYKAPVSLTSVFKPCHSPDLERADFGRQTFSIYLVEQLLLQFASRIHQDQTYLAISNYLVVAI